MLVAAVSAAIAVASAARRFAVTSPRFQITELRIEGNKRLSRSEILSVLGVDAGSNIFDRAPVELREALEHHPWIRSASVSRRLPGFLHVTVKERDAVLLAELDGVYLVSGDGEVFKRLAVSDAVDLPLLTGLNVDRFVSDLEYRRSSIQTGLSIRNELTQVGLPLGDLSEIEVDEDGRVSLVLEPGTLVTMGPPPLHAKFLRIAQLRAQLRRESIQADLIDVSAGAAGRIVVRPRADTI